jgi:hypothetical protein
LTVFICAVEGFDRSGTPRGRIVVNPGLSSRLNVNVPGKDSIGLQPQHTITSFQSIVRHFLRSIHRRNNAALLEVTAMAGSALERAGGNRLTHAFVPDPEGDVAVGKPSTEANGLLSNSPTGTGNSVSPACCGSSLRLLQPAPLPAAPVPPSPAMRQARRATAVA